MTCEEIRSLLPPFADGELDLVRGLEIEQHLEECPDCARALERTQRLSTALRDPALHFQAPAGLEDRIRANLRRAGPARQRHGWRSLLAATAAAILLFVAGWTALHGRLSSGADDLLSRDVVASHVRSLMLDTHRVDVASSDHHQVKPWFLGKVDFAPEVKDLAKQGFPLVGGRLDYLGEHAVAALVYEHGKHAINVFVRRTREPDRAPQAMERQGYHLIHWIAKGQSVWIVSDLNAQELDAFGRLLQEP